jgi:hypothetical protein
MMELLKTILKNFLSKIGMGNRLMESRTITIEMEDQLKNLLKFKLIVCRQVLMMLQRLT